MCTEKNILKKCSTSEIVEVLATREGVREIIAEPYKDVEVKVNGPARILIVTD